MLTVDIKRVEMVWWIYKSLGKDLTWCFGAPYDHVAVSFTARSKCGNELIFGHATSNFEWNQLQLLLWSIEGCLAALIAQP